MAVATKNTQLCDRFIETFSFLGRKWNGLIIESLLNNGPMRFKDLSEVITKCSDRVLVERLKELEQDGIVERRTYPDCGLIEYVLTDKGEAMRPMMESIHTWSDKWAQV